MDKNKKILFLVNKLKVGGAEKSFIRDVNLLTEKGFCVYMAFLFGSADDQLLLSSLKLPTRMIFYCNSRSIVDTNALMRLRNFVKNEGIYAVISTLNEANIFNRFLKIVFPKVRCIVREANVATNKPLKFKIFDLVSYPLTSYLWAVSDGVRESLNYLPKGIITVIENGVDLPPKSAIFRENIEVPKILYVGSLTPKKSIPFLIEGMRTLKDMGHNFSLDIVGDGVDRPKIETLISQYGLSEVNLKGQIEDDKIRNVFYENSDIFILPSQYEGSPNVLLKAMSYRLPVVSSDFQGVTSLIKNGQSGVIVPQGDSKKMAEAVIFYIKNLQERRNIIDSAFELIKQNYTLEAHINKVINLIN